MPRGRRYGQAALRSANLGLSRSSEGPAPDAKIARKADRPQPEKGKERKTVKKKKKEKGLPSLPRGGVLSRFLRKKLRPEGVIFFGKRRSRLTLTGRRRGASFAVFFVFCMRSVCQSVTAINRVISKVIHWRYCIETLAARPDAVPAGLYPAVPGAVLRAVCTSRTTASPNKSLRTALPAAVSYEYQSSALLSGTDGVRASEGFPCAAAATEPTGCALPEGPGRAR